MDKHRFDELTCRFPILAFIDRSLHDGRPVFAGAADAQRLEQCARVLTAEYWSDAVWITGLVPAAAFRRVCDALEREQQNLPPERPLPAAEKPIAA